MAMKIAIPHWQGRVSPLFDASDAIVVIDIERGRERRRDNFKLASFDPVRRAQEVAGLGAEVVVCGAVSRTLENALIGAGIRVKGFICGDLDELVDGIFGRDTFRRLLSNARCKPKPTPFCTSLRNPQKRNRPLALAIQAQAAHGKGE
jgi:predicted Fe-Mo cluster-binding NifX family protein